MISRREFRGDSPDALGGLIRFALRQRMAGASPSPRVWEQIEKRVRRLIAVERARRQVVFDQRPVLPSSVRVSMPYLSVGNALRAW
nr:hypothetical protein [Anaerolineae bacterium]